ncbi:hypothetical protein ABOM_012241 [Aspergillus bombycis]|uniref:Uncharacterized protein n=1 Tax=Aspergillus bombycis TaxID=109264 RepID=A0A1F7ZIB6_9EURO|nr:hypothetical protein ABOM_012241 [Aspergillus bombycis]OGM39193.1 hypothetical protein ABOM_012241 [Aspergillus bombycis]
MGKFLKVLMPWRSGAEVKSREKQITQKDVPKNIPQAGTYQKVSQNFKMDLPRGTLQSDVDQMVFNQDWTLNPQWEVWAVGVKTKRGWEYVFKHKRTGQEYDDVDMIRYRDSWVYMSAKQRQERLARGTSPYLGEQAKYEAARKVNEWEQRNDEWVAPPPTSGLATPTASKASVSRSGQPYRKVSDLEQIPRYDGQYEREAAEKWLRRIDQYFKDERILAQKEATELERTTLVNRMFAGATWDPFDMRACHREKPKERPKSPATSSDDDTLGVDLTIRRTETTSPLAGALGHLGSDFYIVQGDGFSGSTSAPRGSRLIVGCTRALGRLWLLYDG